MLYLPPPTSWPQKAAICAKFSAPKTPAANAALDWVEMLCVDCMKNMPSMSSSSGLLAVSPSTGFAAGAAGIGAGARRTPCSLGVTMRFGGMPRRAEGCV